MAKSVKDHMPWVKVVLCVVERQLDESLKRCTYFDSVVLAQDLGYENFDKYIFKYRVEEACFSLKGKLLSYSFEHYPDEEKFVYLDSDTQLFSPLDELVSILDTHSIVITPHLLKVIEVEDRPLTKYNRHVSIKWRECGLLKQGLFNAGFLALKRTDEAEQFIRWWNYRLDQFCYRNIRDGFNYDQKWLDLVPSFFDAYLLKHPGYNVAFWNLAEREMGITAEGAYTVDGKPLRFFHFSGVGGWLDKIIKRSYLKPEEAYIIHSIYNPYKRKLRRIGINEFVKIPWSYSTFFSGEEIQDETRVRYRKLKDLFYDKYQNPFTEANDKF